MAIEIPVVVCREGGISMEFTRQQTAGEGHTGEDAYAVAISSPPDQLHAEAMALSKQVQTSRIRLVTTRGVLLEIGNALSKRRVRAQGILVLVLTWLEADPAIEIVPLSTDLYTKTFDLFRNRLDKDWGLVDCASFIVMSERGITEALTADEHFEQAGFHALLRGS